MPAPPFFLIKVLTFSTVVFITGILCGVVVVSLGLTGDIPPDFITSMFLGDMSPLTFFIFVLTTNTAVVLHILLGAITGGLLSIAILFLNGLVLGGVLAIVLPYSPSLILLVIPHGIFEYPALIIATAAALTPFLSFISYLFGGEKKVEDVVKTVITLTLLSFAFLFPAAIIETIMYAFVSPLICGG